MRGFIITPIATLLVNIRRPWQPRRSRAEKTNERKEYLHPLPHYDYSASLLDFLILNPALSPVSP